MLTLAWPLALIVVAVLAYRAFHRYLAVSEVTKANQAAIDTLLGMHAELGKRVDGLETTLATRIKEIEDRVKGDSSFRAVAGMMAPKR